MSIVVRQIVTEEDGTLAGFAMTSEPGSIAKGPPSRELAGSFDRGVAFVETVIQKSLAVHWHYGMAEIATFEFHERDCRVFVFDPAEFARRRSSG